MLGFSSFSIFYFEIYFIGKASSNFPDQYNVLILLEFLGGFFTVWKIYQLIDTLVEPTDGIERTDQQGENRTPAGYVYVSKAPALCSV